MKEKLKNKKGLITVVAIALLLISLITIANLNGNNEAKKKTEKKEKVNYKIVYNKEVDVNGVEMTGGVSDEKEAVVIVYLKKAGESQTAKFEMKNNTKDKIIVTKDIVNLRFRYPVDPDDNETYHLIEEEKLKEYYDISVTKPTEPIELEPGASTTIEVTATLKKEYENKTVVGSFFVVLNEP